MTGGGKPRCGIRQQCRTMPAGNCDGNRCEQILGRTTTCEIISKRRPASARCAEKTNTKEDAMSFYEPCNARIGAGNPAYEKDCRCIRCGRINDGEEICEQCKKEVKNEDSGEHDNQS